MGFIVYVFLFAIGSLGTLLYLEPTVVLFSISFIVGLVVLVLLIIGATAFFDKDAKGAELIQIIKAKKQSIKDKYCPVITWRSK